MATMALDGGVRAVDPVERHTRADRADAFRAVGHVRWVMLAAGSRYETP